MIDQINAAKPVHILTIEDPIEVLHSPKQASVSQRELGLDTETYLEAMRSAMRQDPDVILIGEMRDHETVGAALAAAETGHLVLSTLHTTDAVETVNRVVDFFPSSHQHQVRVSLASVLRGVICQRLVQRLGSGRIPVVEILVNNGRVADRIRDPDTTEEFGRRARWFGSSTSTNGCTGTFGSGWANGPTERPPVTALPCGTTSGGGSARRRPRLHSDVSPGLRRIPRTDK